METREFYDERAPEEPSGLFDLSRWPAPMRARLITMVNQRLSQVCPSVAEMRLTEECYGRLPEPPNGPNTQWRRASLEARQALEIAVGSNLSIMVRLERVYRFNFKAFQPRDWKLLASLFSQMPGWKGSRPYPHWFGLQGDPPPRLWGKIETNGLRVRGELSQGRWSGWDTWIRRNMHEFPIQ